MTYLRLWILVNTVQKQNNLSEQMQMELSEVGGGGRGSLWLCGERLKRGWAHSLKPVAAGDAGQAGFDSTGAP